MRELFSNWIAPIGATIILLLAIILTLVFTIEVIRDISKK
jgi:hypothetical protein